MPYKPFLIAPYKTGLELGMPTWMIPKDAWTELTDAFLFRGVVRKRNGYSQFARLPHLVNNENIGTGNGSQTTFTKTLVKTPIAPGSVVIKAPNTSDVTMTVTDNGNGVLTGDGTGTIDYSTGGVSVTFNSAVKSGAAVLATYNFYAGLPVMGLWNYVNAGGSESLMAFDTKRAFVYDDVNRLFKDITGGTDVFSGGESTSFGFVTGRMLPTSLTVRINFTPSTVSPSPLSISIWIPTPTTLGLPRWSLPIRGT